MNDSNNSRRGGGESQAPNNDQSQNSASLWNSPLGRRAFLKKTGAATVATAVALHGFKTQVQAQGTGLKVIRYYQRAATANPTAAATAATAATAAGATQACLAALNATQAVVVVQSTVGPNVPNGERNRNTVGPTTNPPVRIQVGPPEVWSCFGVIHETWEVVSDN